MKFADISDSASFLEYVREFGPLLEIRLPIIKLRTPEVLALQQQPNGLLARMLLDEPDNQNEFLFLRRAAPLGGDAWTEEYWFFLNLDHPIPGKKTFDYCKREAKTSFEHSIVKLIEELLALSIGLAQKKRRLDTGSKKV